MEKEYKFVKDFEGIFDENQKINLYIFDLEANSHILGFSGEAGIFYSLINKNSKFGQFYGNFEVLDMFQSSVDEGTLIIMCKFPEKTLKDKLDEVKPIIKAKRELKDNIENKIDDLIKWCEQWADDMFKKPANKICGKYYVVGFRDVNKLVLVNHIKKSLKDLSKSIEEM